MLLRSYSFMPPEIDIGLHYEIWKEVNNLRWYFFKFAGLNAEEAMSKTLIHTLTHFDQERGSLSAYVKKLAREITKDNSRLIYVDFLDQTVSEDDESGEASPTVNLGSIRDFSEEVIEEMVKEEDRKPEVVALALQFMDKFLQLCEILRIGDTSSKYFPVVFRKACLTIAERCVNFHQLCFEVYDEWADKMRWFLEIGEANENWREADFMLIRNSTSKRLRFVDPFTKVPVEDADISPYVLQGRIGEGDARKRIIRARYYEIWEMMCDLVDSSETNELKFVIGDLYIIRTFGGGLSMVNTDLFNMYNLLRNELLTNVLLDTVGRVLSVGSENFYILCGLDMDKTYMERSVHGHDFRIDYVDITDSVDATL